MHSDDDNDDPSYIYIWCMHSNICCHDDDDAKKKIKKTRPKLIAVLVIANNQIRRSKLKFLDTFNEDPVHRRGSFLSFMFSSGFAIAP